ncbi:MAG: dienelactone hydrolase family protein [Candidatus Sumerlaeia bacterium]|nr:dienelactone hydrolase family protein [Candidatus Sumerlaeia bacterium]
MRRAAAFALACALAAAGAAQDPAVRHESSRIALALLSGAESPAGAFPSPEASGDAALAAQALAAQGVAKRVLGPQWRGGAGDDCVVLVPVEFPGATLAVELAWSGCAAKAGSLASIDVVPYVPAPKSTPAPPEPGRAPYVDPLLYRETELALAAGSAELAAVFAEPARAAPGARAPAALLLAADGPRDADGTDGMAKPLRDIAQALACNGVASLRADKRTLHPRALDPVLATFEDEYLADAREALALLRAQPSVDPARIAVVGHGLGAWAALRLAAEDPDIAAVALLNPPVEFSPATLLERIEAAKPADAAGRERLRLAREVAGRWRQGSMGAVETFEGFGRNYWESVGALRPLEDARLFSGRLFAAFGGKDAELSRAAVAGWREALAANPNAKAAWFPEADGRFVYAGEGAPEAPWVMPEALVELLAFLRAERRAP